jgi:hypothetical protein
MEQKIFQASSKFWNWIVTSSQDPSQVALTVQGFFSLGVIESVFALLPTFGIHPSFTLNNLGDCVAGAVQATLTLVAAVTALYGAIRKVYLTINAKPSTPSTPVATSN